MLTAMCIAAANYIIDRTNIFNQSNPNRRISMTCKRLQKILYFSGIEYMKRNDGESMFNDEFYAWPSGPVIPSVYHKFSDYQSGKMETKTDGCHSPLTRAMVDAIDYVLEVTWDSDTIDLINESHIDGGPWRRFYRESDPKHEQLIPQQEIYNYYKTHPIFRQINR